MAGTLGVLLAGGRGARLGGAGPKALARLGGETLLDRARRTLAAACDAVVVSAPPGIAVRLGVPDAVPDAPGGAGPLAGVVAGLASRPYRRAIVLGVDFPLVRPATLTALLERLARFDAVIPEPGGVPQPLVAAYAARAAMILTEAWRRGERSIVAAARGLDALRMDDQALAAIEGGPAVFFNVNAPADLAEAGRLLAAERVG